MLFQILTNVDKAISFRMGCALVTSFIICLVLAPTLIRKLKEKQIGQNIREELQEHKPKAGVPTMGGMLILISMLVSVAFWAKPVKPVIVAVAGLLWLGLTGFVDDYLKVVKKQSEGFKKLPKFAMQFVFALAVAIYLYNTEGPKHMVWVPVAGTTVDIGWMYIPFVVLVVTGASNAVNLTDGLDGLAAGVVIVVALVYAALAYISGRYDYSAHLLIPHVRDGGELAVFCTAMAGACVGFLWYNANPASIFMGDVGALALGGAIGVVALLIKQELLLVLVGGIFVIEALSVIIQVTSFKLRDKKKVFLKTPIHHHFELSGWKEPKIVIRFWIVTLMLALCGLSLLGLNRLLAPDLPQPGTPAPQDGR